MHKRNTQAQNRDTHELGHKASQTWPHTVREKGWLSEEMAPKQLEVYLKSKSKLDKALK